MKPTLVILAAGMGSRYGGLKQLDEVGPNGEAIIDYSLFDAIRAGFGKVVFIVRESFADAFREKFGSKLDGKVEVEYVFQELDKLPEGFPLNPDREKPWGTGHAVLMAKDVVNEPFVVINADDFYGPGAFQEIAAFLKKSTEENEYAMVGYRLANTLSDFGSVSRGVCKADSDGNLKEVNERTKIQREDEGVFYYEDDQRFPLTGEESVSMNFWGVKPSIFKYLENGFHHFLQEGGNELKSEFFFPFLVDEKIQEGKVSCKVLRTNSPWFGVTYKEDRPFVQKKINELIADGIYPSSLW